MLLRIVLCVALIAALCVSAVAAELEATVPSGELEVLLRPGSSRALVRDIRSIEYSSEEQSVIFSYGAAKVVEETIRLLPPEGLTVARAFRPAGKTHCLVWKLEGDARPGAPTVLSYEVEDLKWRTCYRLKYEPDAKTANCGRSSIEADIEITNETGLDLMRAGFALRLDERDALSDLCVRGREVNLAMGWTRRWRLERRDGSGYVVANIPTDVWHVFDPRVYANDVHKLLLLTASPGSLERLWLQNLPEGELEVFLPGSGDAPSELPDVVTKWYAQEGLADLGGVEAKCRLQLDVGVEPAVRVEPTMLSVTKERVNFDRLGRVCGMDIVERHRLGLLNRTGEDVNIAMFQELLPKWELKVTQPEVAARSQADDEAEEKNAPLWSGVLGARMGGSVEFTLTKHQGTNE